MVDHLISPSYTKGYALCTAGGVLLSHSYRATEADAIASVFQNPVYRAEFWKAAQAQGMTVRFVCAHIFTPKFFVTDRCHKQADAA